MYKLNQLKTPIERVLELLGKVADGTLAVDSISIERSTGDSDERLLQIVLELRED